jgi:hypothetical protein
MFSNTATIGGFLLSCVLKDEDFDHRNSRICLICMSTFRVHAHKVQVFAFWHVSFDVIESTLSVLWMF